MTALQLTLQPFFLCSVQPVRDEKNPDKFLDGDAPLNCELLESQVDGSVEDLHELDRVFGAPSSRYWHKDNGSPLLFMAHLLFLWNKL
jgi:hypothetical protein